MSTDRSEPICVYCGQRDGTTKDHVPPKGLFATPRPHLVTVPCCEQCRQGQSLDDEYFLRSVSFKDGIAENSSVRAARGSALRALTKPRKAAFRQSLIDSMRDVAIYSPAGIYLGEGTSYHVDLARLCKVIERTTRGLYSHELKARLPEHHRCMVYAVDGFGRPSAEIRTQLQQLWGHATSGKRENFGHNVFTYWFRRIEGPENATLWSFLVYGNVAFLAFTGPIPQGLRSELRAPNR